MSDNTESITVFQCNELLKEHRIRFSIHGKLSNTAITSLCYDSRLCSQNSLFFCKGENFKTKYLYDAISKNITAIVCDDPALAKIARSADITVFLVENVRKAMALISAFYYGFPFSKLYTIAVTGTKGKTTAVNMLKSVLCKKNGIRAAILSDHAENNTLTTPESPDIHKAARSAYMSGATHLICEISSQAEKHLRTYGIIFDCGCFLNLSSDHISPCEHSCLQEYFLCKSNLFLHCKKAFISIDSTHGQLLSKICKSHDIPTFTLGKRDSKADLILIPEKEGIFCAYDSLTKQKERFYLSLKGSYNAENALFAYAVAKSLDVSKNDIFRAFSSISVHGRGESIVSDNGKVTVVVDRAHNGASFRALLSHYRDENPDAVFTAVFGCPGNKAHLRRYQLPFEALRYCDRITVCDDDSASEGFEAIKNDILKSIEDILKDSHTERSNAMRACVTVCKERERAIYNAVFSAFRSSKTSFVFILGRGRDGVSFTETGVEEVRSDLTVAKEAVELINQKTDISDIFPCTKAPPHSIVYIPKNDYLLCGFVKAVSSLAKTHRNIAAYVAFSELDYLRYLCYKNGLICHICSPDTDFMSECFCCFRAGILPVFTSKIQSDVDFCDIVSRLSFEKAVYLTEKKGIMLDGKKQPSSLSYDCASLISENMKSSQLSALMLAAEKGAKEAVFLNRADHRSLTLCLSGSSAYGTRLLS